MYCMVRNVAIGGGVDSSEVGFRCRFSCRNRGLVLTRFASDNQCADESRQEYDRNHLEGENEIGHEYKTNGLNFTEGIDLRSGEGQDTQSTAECVQDFGQEGQSQQKNHPPFPIKGGFFHILLSQVKQHDNEQEQHHDGTRIDDNLDNRQKLCLEGEEQSTDAEEVKDGIEHRVNGVTSRDEADGPDEPANAQHPE